jgi:septum site-determining protein MinC
VLDFGNVEAEMDKDSRVPDSIVGEVKKLKLIPVGMSYTNSIAIQDFACRHKMPLLNTARNRGQTIPLDSNAESPDLAHVRSKLNDTRSAESILYTPPLIVKSSVRSGHQVYARDGADLVVLGSVHSGAEVLADGNIHIYGTLKGRALAGVSGGVNAKIFVGKFDAELISISDAYLVCETRPTGASEAKPTVVWLEDGKLTFASTN